MWSWSTWKNKHGSFEIFKLQIMVSWPTPCCQDVKLKRPCQKNHVYNAKIHLSGNPAAKYEDVFVWLLNNLTYWFDQSHWQVE